MNAVIALCHFCELHGPSILFCTQAFHATPPSSSGDIFVGIKESTSSETSKSRSSSTDSSSSQASAAEHTPPSKTQLCEACRSFQPGQPNFISHDHDAHISYISTQYPRNPQVFTVVRQACIRSLSCEVCPGREGPIFFGDEHHGYVLSYTFFIKDSKARGFQRWYSIIVVMMDRIFLLNSWPFLISNIRSLIDELQEKAIKVYDKEQTDAPQRAQRMNHELLSPAISRNDHIYRRRGGGGQTYRAIVALTGDNNLYRYLHMTFSWILKVGGSRMTEKQLEGPPKEDTLVDLDNEEETEEGFIKVATKPAALENPNEEAQMEAGAAQCAKVMYDDGGPTFSGLQHLRVVLGSLNFRELAFHALIGNQVIVRCKHKSTLKSFFEVFETILPMGCCRTTVHSDEYKDSYMCNFLGLSHDTDLPDHMKSSEFYIMLDLVQPDDTTESMSKVIAESSDPFNGYGLVMSSSASLPDKGPTILGKIENVLDNKDFTNTIVDTFLLTLREQWMSKVKLLFKFTRAGSHTDEETDQLLQVLKAGSEDKAMLRFWISGLSSQYKSHLLTSNLGS